MKRDPIGLEGAHPTARPDRPFFARSIGATFEISALVGEGGAEIDLYDEIGFFGVSAKAFRERLNAIDADRILLRINSPGGDVFDGIAIYNDLVAHRAEVRVEVTGLAASAASIVAMAGDHIAIAKNAFMMIHNAWGIVVGNRHDMRQFASTLDKIDAALARTYVARTGTGIRTIEKMMDSETWLSAKEAEELGFADSLIEAADTKVRFDLSVFANAPQALSLTQDAEAEPMTLRDVDRMLTQDAGYSKAMRRAIFRAVKSEAPRPRQDAGDAELVKLASLLASAAESLRT